MKAVNPSTRKAKENVNTQDVMCKHSQARVEKGQLNSGQGELA